jgi:hypothetical protein
LSKDATRAASRALAVFDIDAQAHAAGGQNAQPVAAGLKSTEKMTPVGSFSEIWLFFSHWTDGSRGEDHK